MSKVDLDQVQLHCTEDRCAPVPALVAELRAARAELDHVPALLQERDALRGLLQRHHEYIAGLTGEACLLCVYDRAATGESQ